jgi:type IV pilus assembly protein PilV
VIRGGKQVPGGERGSTLIEVLIAVLLFSVGVIGLVRLLGAAMRETGEIEYRAQAAEIADELVGQMWVDRTNLASYVVTDAALAALPAGTQTVAVNGNIVTVTITWQPPGSPARNHVTLATLAGN